jgi:phosphate uptake regulator
MAKHFQRELDKIKKMILSLGALVEQRVHRIKQAIEDRDVELAKRSCTSITRSTRWRWRSKRSA